MPNVAAGDIVRHGLVFNPKSKMPIDDIRSAVEGLFDEFDRESIDYVLVGGVALLSFVEGRNTQDVDLIINVSDVDRMPWNARVLDGNFAEATFRGVHVDLLLSSNALFDEVRRTERAPVAFGERTITCATREGLLLLKLYALPSLYRQHKLARAALYETDILMLHQGVDVDDRRLLNRLRPHLAAHDVAELENILREQSQRKRFAE